MLKSQVENEWTKILKIYQCKAISWRPVNEAKKIDMKNIDINHTMMRYFAKLPKIIISDSNHCPNF